MASELHAPLVADALLVLFIAETAELDTSS